MIYKEIMRQKNIIEKYNEFISKDEIIDFSDLDFNAQHERYCYYYMINNSSYKELVSNEGDIHGFDGILINNEKVFFYEAKFKTDKSYSTIFDSAVSTNKEIKGTRVAPLQNSKKILEKEEGYFKNKEIELINQYLGEVRDKKEEFSIPLKRMTLGLGGTKDMKKIQSKTFEKMNSAKDVLVVEYEKRK